MCQNYVNLFFCYFGSFPGWLLFCFLFLQSRGDFSWLVPACVLLSCLIGGGLGTFTGTDWLENGRGHKAIVTTLSHRGDGTSRLLSASFVFNASLSNIPHHTSKHTDAVWEGAVSFFGLSVVNLLFHLKEITFTPGSRKYLLAAAV